MRIKTINPLYFLSGLRVVLKMKFNYCAIIGNSGQGKTTFLKEELATLNYDMAYFCTPNREYGDLTGDKAKYIGPVELQNAINFIGKSLLFQKKKGVLVIEDLGLTIRDLSEVLKITEKKAKQIILLLLENLRKYDVKILVAMHDIDEDITGKCDLKVFFQVPLNDYKVRKYSALYGLDLREVRDLAKYHYIVKNGSEEIVKVCVLELKSHKAIENNKDFQVNERLKECGSLRAKILVLRNQGQQRNCDIAKTLNIERHTVETEIWKIRKRGIVIPDARRSFQLENLAF